MTIPRRCDHYVKFLREETIEAVALAARRAAANENCAYFDITDFVERLSAKGLKTGPLRIRFFDMRPGDDPGYVEFDDDPIDKASHTVTTLNIDRGIWEDAKLGEPIARYILAHEVGHVLLHDKDAKAFSDDPKLHISFSRLEYSAEWQANTFADYFLLPTHIVASLDNLNSLIGSCAVTNELAQRRLLSVRKQKYRSAAYEGEACCNCGNFTLVRNGICLKCDTCGQPANQRRL